MVDKTSYSVQQSKWLTAGMEADVRVVRIGQGVTISITMGSLEPEPNGALLRRAGKLLTDPAAWWFERVELPADNVVIEGDGNGNG
jgi:hypothetical protein